MGYKDLEAKRAYQREWLAARRSAWLSVNGPCIDCESWDNLEVDHVDRSTKAVNPTVVWSWSKDRREAELEKCVARCALCHKVKTSAEISREPEHGRNSGYDSGCRCLSCVEFKKEKRKRTSSQSSRLIESKGDK